MLGGWTEFGAELAEIDRHAATEQDSRRPGSGRVDHPPRYPPDNVAALGAIAGRYGHDPQAPAAKPRTALELQAHVSIILEIFPRRESMPVALADDLALMLNERLAVEFESVERIVEAIAGPRGLNERAALAVAAQDPDVLAALEDAKRHAAATVAAMRERVVLLERAEVVQPQPDHWSRMRMWTSRLARPPPQQETVESELDLGPNRGAASAAAYRELRLDARLLRAESALATASEKLASASPLLRADIRAAPVGAEQGRAVISSTAPARDARSLAQLIERPYPRASTRYPAGRQEWKGFFRDATKPYNFRTDVVDFQNLHGVGGGIHFGSHAEPSADARWRLEDGAHLYYDADTRYLTLTLLSGEGFTYGPVQPRVLKSLYSYVTSYPGINLAITIGATGPDADVRENNQQPVLLDPAFVDTPVGQWLYLADTLPWELDEPALPNGAGQSGSGAVRPGSRRPPRSERQHPQPDYCRYIATRKNVRPTARRACPPRQPSWADSLGGRCRDGIGIRPFRAGSKDCEVFAPTPRHPRRSAEWRDSFGSRGVQDPKTKLECGRAVDQSLGFV